MHSILSLTPLVLLATSTFAFPTFEFPEYRSLAGLSSEEIREVSRNFKRCPGAQPAPPAINDTSSKLVNDDAHPWMPLEEGQIRGPCPGLNTLASHGYLNRSGIVSPGDIITAVQEGFNMGWHLATFVTYAAFLVDGNQLTNLVSIGAESSNTGTNAPAPGLNTHGNFEGDASTTRGDAFFGDNFNFNETLFDQFAQAANDYGNGTINLASASVHRHNRILDSMARNPNFTFTIPRYLTAYGETTFPLGMFVNHQDVNSTAPLSLDDARSILQESKYPDNFYRREGAFDFPQVAQISKQVYEFAPVSPGHNEGAGNYVLDDEPSLLDGGLLCLAYYKQMNLTVSLYPNPTGDLLEALKQNVATFYSAMGASDCAQVFPFGE